MLKQPADYRISGIAGAKCAADVKGKLRGYLLDSTNHKRKFPPIEVYHAPDLGVDLLSVNDLVNAGYEVSFHESEAGIFTPQGDFIPFLDRGGDGLWRLEIHTPESVKHGQAGFVFFG